MKKAQSLLDFVLIFGILVGVTVGFTRIWFWFDANLAKRNVDYQNTRLSAGTATVDDSRVNSLVYEDKQLALNDDWIFKGKTSETINKSLLSPTGVNDPNTNNGSDTFLSDACTSAQTTASFLNSQAADLDSQAQKLDDVADLGDDWYDPLYIPFIIMGISTDDMHDSATKLRQGASEIRTEASDLVTNACTVLSGSV